MKKEWTVVPSESGSKLVAFLKAKLGDAFSLRQLKQMIERNLCTVNGRIERFASTTLGVGDRVSFVPSFLLKPVLTKAISFEKSRILYEDHDLLAYNKPAGAISSKEGIEATLRGYCATAQLLHRLDRDTTGILLFAKTPLMVEKMLALFHQRQVKKTYLAIVDGVFEKKEGVIENCLGAKKKIAGQVMYGSTDAHHGTFASTKWHCLKKGSHTSLIRCLPKTGRTHQLRVHLSELGHPILGDTLYGKAFKSSYHPARCLLHAWELEFSHPAMTKKIVITAPLPPDFSEALEELELHFQ